MCLLPYADRSSPSPARRWRAVLLQRVGFAAAWREMRPQADVPTAFDSEPTALNTSIGGCPVASEFAGTCPDRGPAHVGSGWRCGRGCQ